jgi:hypothetical protein
MKTLNDYQKRIIENSILDIATFGTKSVYVELENVVIRIADHLPNVCNFDSFNEGVNNVILVLVENEYSGDIAHKFFNKEDELDSEFSHYGIENYKTFFVFEANNIEENIQEIEKMINKF